MAGIYVHIPFCKKACCYCDFHFSTSLKTKPQLLEAIKNEAIIRSNYLKGEEIETVYLGGGTPSILTPQELSALFNVLYEHYNINSNAEITLEANPDDLNKEKVEGFRNTPINRLSIGTQSFFNEDLEFMNRAHDAAEAEQSILIAQEAGFKNLTIDLIYGLPDLSDEKWISNLQKVKELDIPHFSAYALTVESKTALAHAIKSNQIAPLSEEKAISHMKVLMLEAQKNGYVPYEISNFGKEGFFSKHNTAYWQQKKYIGLGPSAHSYNGLERQWNIRNNVGFIKAIEENDIFFEKEELTLNDRYNEYVMTAMRTIWGCSLAYIEESFGEGLLEHFKKEANRLLNSGEINFDAGTFSLSEKGKLVADKISSELFATD